MNVNKSSVKECTSCQMCAAVCPKDAITISLNDTGFYRPIINSDLCVDCGLCVSICYKYNDVAVSTIEELKNYQMLSAAAKEPQVLKKTTSGGVGYLLAKTLYGQGYNCYGVVYDVQTHRAYHKLATTADDIEKFCGSKYIQSYTIDALKSIIRHSTGSKNVVFGTPCQIYSLSLYLNKRGRRNDFILIDIYCHGCPSMLIWDKYVMEFQKQSFQETMTSVSFRSKVKGWGNFHVEFAYDKNGSVFSGKNNDEFYKLFFSDMMLNDSCANCRLRSTLQYSDIRLGDFWGHCYDTNRTGVSGVTIMTDSGQYAFDQIKNKISWTKHDFSDFLPYQSWGKRYEVPQLIRQQMFKKLVEPQASLTDVVNIYYKSLPYSQRIKHYLKILTGYLPQSIVRLIKKGYHYIRK